MRKYRYLSSLLFYLFFFFLLCVFLFRILVGTDVDMFRLFVFFNLFSSEIFASSINFYLVENRSVYSFKSNKISEAIFITF